jgi:hypothetical protein
MPNHSHFALTGATTTLLVALLATVLPVAMPLRADVFGVILGTVVDTSGAVAPGAKVVLRNADTGLLREAATDASGNYEFLAVPVGENYVVEVSVEGFKKTAQSGIKLLVNQRFRANFRLEVGEFKQEVNISANVAQVETVSTQLGDVIEDKKMQDLPLNGRSYLDLLGLQSGVVPISTTVSGQPVSGNLSAGLLSVNGQRENTNAFMLNGGYVQEVFFNGAAVVPTLDSIQEFRILTNSFDAEYGDFSGSVVNVVTKSGSNAFHGTAFEFLRNEKLDARNFFDLNQTDPVTGQEIPGSAIGVFRRNQFGGAVGGPILKNRLFFFFDYQGMRESRGATTGIVSVPSLLERQGDFSDVGTTGYAALTGIVRGSNNPSDGAMPTVLSQALGYPVVSGEPYWVAGCNTLADAQAGMCVFPNQVIPQAAWSPVAKAELKFIPTPTATLASGQPFFSTSAFKNTTNDDKLGTRIDLVNKRTGNWSFYYNYDKATVVDPYSQSNIPGFAGGNPSKAQHVNVSNIHTFGPSAVNEARVTFTRVFYLSGQPVQGLGRPSAFGFQEGGLGLNLQVDPSLMGVPYMEMDQLGLYYGAAVPQKYAQNNFNIFDAFSKVTGKHTLKFGGRAGYSQWNVRGNCCDNGGFYFYGSETGNDFADLLIGAPDLFDQSGPTADDARLKSIGVYGQDSYRIQSNLTLNYGLRWELGQPWSETQNRLPTFVPGLQSQLFTNAPTGYVFPHDPGIPRTLAPTRYADFMPRLGIAYSPAASEGLLKKIFGGPGKTSIRIGAGMFYTSFDTRWHSWQEAAPPYTQFQISSVPIYLDEPYKSRINGNNPGQRFPSPPPTPNMSWAPFQPIFMAAYEPTNTVPYSEGFNFTIQRELPASTILSIGYVGSRGHHLFSFLDLNPGNIGKCLEIRNLFNAAGQAGNGCGPFGQDSIYSINGQTFYGTRPYSVTSGRYLSQGLLDFIDGNYEATIGNSNYNALQVTLNKTRGPLSFLAAYTYSKSLDNSSQMKDYVNPYNPRLSKSLSSFDMTHNFVVSYSYDLPLDRLAHAQGRVGRGILAGWTLAGITRFATGVPVQIKQSGDLSLCGCDEGTGGTSVDFPNYSGAPIQFSNPRTSPNFQYFSTAAFSSEELGVPGNANRRFFHGPGLNNWDVSLFKNVRFTERVSMDIRAEFFNVFNHAQFNNPRGDFSSSQFGEVTSARDPRIGQVAVKIHF